MLLLQIEPVQLGYLLIAFLISFTVHEASHAWVAYRLGDDTAREMGRLTLNPLAHLHPIGTLLILFVGLGFGRPVPIDAARLKPNPKAGMGLVGVAGPASNLILASAFAIPLRLRLPIFARWELADMGIWLSYGEFLSWLVWLNIGLAVFNMIPFTPLDGSRLLAAALPDRWFRKLAQVEIYAFVVFLALVLLERFLQTGLLAAVLSPPIRFLWWRLTGLTPPFPFF